MNPLNTLVVKMIEPCNCGGTIALDFWQKVIHIPVRPHFKSNARVKKPKATDGLGNEMMAKVARISEQESNLGILAKAILMLDKAKL